MKKQVLSIVAILAFAVTGAFAQTTWKVDKGHSNVKFAVTHMVVSEVEGAFKMFDGSLVASKADLSDAVVNFSVDVNSINTDSERRDGHLKSDDFFNAEKFPQMKFASKSMKPSMVNKSLPKYYALTKAIYPELDTLNEDTRGALVSMIYNRGNKLDGDRRKEMRAIVNLVAKADYEGIADQIERSKRLWENVGLDGLVKRREEEADLILNSIA